VRLWCVFLWWRSVDAGLPLFWPSRVLFWLFFLSLFATIRGGTLFLKTSILALGRVKFVTVGVDAGLLLFMPARVLF